MYHNFYVFALDIDATSNVKKIYVIISEYYENFTSTMRPTNWNIISDLYHCKFGNYNNNMKQNSYPKHTIVESVSIKTFGRKYSFQ